jgi:hypothetical protein
MVDEDRVTKPNIGRADIPVRRWVEKLRGTARDPNPSRRCCGQECPRAGICGGPWTSWGLPIAPALASLSGETQTRTHRFRRDRFPQCVLETNPGSLVWRELPGILSRVAPLNRSSRRKEALTSWIERVSLLTSAATRSMGRIAMTARTWLPQGFVVLLCATAGGSAALAENLPVTHGEARTPKTTTLTVQEAAPALESDWLFQAMGEPLLDRAVKEIGWTRQLAERMSREPQVPDLSAELKELEALEQRPGRDCSEGEPRMTRMTRMGLAGETFNVVPADSPGGDLPPGGRTLLNTSLSVSSVQSAVTSSRDLRAKPAAGRHLGFGVPPSGGFRAVPPQGGTTNREARSPAASRCPR